MQPHAAKTSRIDRLVEQIVHSYLQDPRTHHLDATYLPSRDKTVQIIELLRRLMFPGFFDDCRLTSETIHFHVGDLLNRTRELMYEQVREAIRYEQNRTQGPSRGDDGDHCDQEAQRVTLAFLELIPDLRRLLSLDVQAAFGGDPAAVNTDETVFSYPGVEAIFTHRVAHELWLLKVPMLPRIMSEHTHSRTGIDIHPGATIGESFFIDHGTGVVIGETTSIGDRVKIYQGVTLGALSTKGGQAWRHRKRHPTIEDDVTIYGGAIILGGNTVIGHGAIIGGSVFITQSVPPDHTVTMKLAELKMTVHRHAAKKARPSDEPTPPPHPEG